MDKAKKWEAVEAVCFVVGKGSHIELDRGGAEVDGLL